MVDSTRVLRPNKRIYLLGTLTLGLAVVAFGVGSALGTIEKAPDTKASNVAAPASSDPASPAPSPSPSPSPSPVINGVALPDVVGRRLADADKILKDAGFKNIRLADASGKGRIIIDKDNWIVAAMEPSGSAPAFSSAITLKVRKPTDGKGSQTIEKGVIPDIVCKDLQDARDALTRAGFGKVTTEDGQGQHRPQIFPRDWIVIAQSVAKGTSPPADTKITLTVVRYRESTGDSGCES